MKTSKFYQAQLLDICNHNTKKGVTIEVAELLLVPFTKKGWFITAAFDLSLLPEGTKVNDYFIVELPQKARFSDKWKVFTEGIITINSNPDMSYFKKNDFFKDMDISWLKGENYE